MDMANPLNIFIKESISELRLLQRKQSAFIAKRIEVLIVIKQYEKQGGISKRDLSLKTGTNHNSINKWRKQYLSDGITSLLSHGRKGFKPTVLNEEEHKAIEDILSNPKNNLQGYKELVDWVKKQFNKEIKYTTLNEYCKRHFKSKVKVARRSHVKKDEKAVASFKKTSVTKLLTSL
jgi:hypothetical protein